MSDQKDFIPALGRAELTGDYDRVIAVMTRERRWRAVLLDLLDPFDGELIAEIGAGTGSQAIAIKARCPGARVVIAVYGLQRTLLMRLLFRQVQAMDGWERTGFNAKGKLPDLMAAAGLLGVAERRVIPTPTGSISLYVATTPGAGR